MYRVSREAYIKFEQGYQQKEFIDHLFNQMKGYSFMESPGIRYSNNNVSNEIKSYWFKTYSHSTFSAIYDLFYPESNYGRKSISTGIITNYLEKEGLAYWIMGDGSLHNLF